MFLNLGDVTKISHPPFADCVIGGSPCQDLSVAGARTGLAGERSGLFLEMIRVIKEMREDSNGKYPRFAVWENVPGAFSSNGGEDFRCVLEEFCRIADSDAIVPGLKKWEKAGAILGEGWSLAWRVHDAQFWGVPQRRKRISLVADFRGGGAPEVLFERQGLPGNPGEGEETREGAPEAPGGRTDTAISAQDRASNGFIAGTEEPRCAGLQLRKGTESRSLGYQDEVAPTLGAYRNEGVLVFEPRSQDGVPRVYPNGVVPTLNTAQGGQRQPCVIEMGSTKNDVSTDGICQTLKARMGTGGNNVNAVVVPADIYSSDRGGCAGSGSENLSEFHVVARRLTPTECERLQGFPDGWTDIGEWADSKGKTHRPADTPRYKALGNSIALPFWQWLIDRISDYMGGTPTLGSLFSGIGGFDLCWERKNGPGTVAFCSEIDEFPCAVLKARFDHEADETRND